MSVPAAQFFSDYANHRAAEGRGYRGAALHALPYLKTGPFAKQWAVRARSFDVFAKHVVAPMARTLGRPLNILDLGAGNGWLSNRVARMGHKAVALDIRNDTVDGLGVATEFLRDTANLFECVNASFDDMPLGPARFDITIFNASLHYAQNLSRALREATRVTKRDGAIIVLDSPFYAHDEDGVAMVAEKHAQGHTTFGTHADVLLGQNFIEYLTYEKLRVASTCLIWSRRRVLYPLWYEMRPLLARLKGKRAPSRFDLWMALVP
jgi:ubiquinone/menaquinone biosynthesis C-methylase UbiE